MRTMFRVLLLLAPMVIAAPHVSHAAYSGLNDNGSTISYYGGNSSGDFLSFSFNGGSFVTPPQNGAAATGTAPSDAPFTMQINNSYASSFTTYQVLFESNGEVVAGFTDGGVGTLITLVYNDYLAEGATAPTPTGADTIINLDATGSGSTGANGGPTNGFGVAVQDLLPAPEPASIALLGTGLTVLGLRRRRKA